MQRRYQFCLNQYFYKFMMLIFCCQLLCHVHLGYHRFIYDLFVSFRLCLKLSYFPSPPLVDQLNVNFGFGGSCYLLIIFIYSWSNLRNNQYFRSFFFFFFSRLIYEMCLPSCFLPWQRLYNSKVLPIKVITYQIESFYRLSTAACLQTPTLLLL